jgi:hypothetical protein
MENNVRHHGGSEIALGTILGGLAIGGFYKKVWTARWRRGKDMRNIILYGMLLFGELWILIDLFISSHSNIYLNFGVAGFLALIFAPIIFTITTTFWELVIVKYYISPRQRTTHLHQRQIFLPEAMAMKDQAFHNMTQVAPFLGAAAIWSMVDQNTSAVVIDGVVGYQLVLKDLQFWSNAQNILENGGEFWVDVPPRDCKREFLAVAGSYLIGYILAWWLDVLGGWFITNGNTGGRVVEVIIVAFVLLIVFRKHIARSLEASAIRRDH